MEESTSEDTGDRIVQKRNGVGAYGLSIDYLRLSSLGEVLTQERVFLALNMVCRYTRARGMKRAAWTSDVYETHDDARKAVVADLAMKTSDHTPGVTLMAPPLCVELAKSDVASIGAGMMPHARHTGVVSTERISGKVNDDDIYSTGYAHRVVEAS